MRRANLNRLVYADMASWPSITIVDAGGPDTGIRDRSGMRKASRERLAALDKQGWLRGFKGLTDSTPAQPEIFHGGPPRWDAIAACWRAIQASWRTPDVLVFPSRETADLFAQNIGLAIHWGEDGA